MRARLLGRYVIDVGFVEQNFPGICSGEPRDGTAATNRPTTSVPHELRCLEEILATPGLQRKQQYVQLIERLTAKTPRTNELSDWVRSRGKTIQQFKTELPLTNAYLEKITSRRPR